MQNAEFAIICVTPYNFTKPWINFEAGALARFVPQSDVTPFLFRVNRSEVKGPLAQFQSTLYNESDILNLIYSINNKLGQTKLDHELLSRTFNTWWPELKACLDLIMCWFSVKGRAAVRC